MKAWRAIRRAPRAVGEQASTPEGCAIDMRSSRFVRVLTSSVLGAGTSPVLGGAIKSIVLSNSSFKIGINTTVSSRTVAGRYSSGQGKHNTEIPGGVLWAGRGKHFTSGRLASSNSNIKIRSSTEGSDRIVGGGCRRPYEKADRIFIAQFAIHQGILPKHKFHTSKYVRKTSLYDKIKVVFSALNLARFDL